MFNNLHVHSHFSLLDGLSKSKQIAKRCAELGQTACALTDHGNISGAIAFTKACKKNNIKPILGIEAYVTTVSSTLKDKDNKVAHQIILAKNLDGWYQLIQLVSKSNDADRFYYKPRIDIDIMKEFCNDNMISFSGHLGSTLHIRPDKEKYVNLMKQIFGEDNFFIEVQLIDSKNSPASVQLAKTMRELAEITHTKCIATGDAHYPTQQDAIDHQVLICSAMQTTLKKARNNPRGLTAFFNSNQFFIPSEQDIIECGNTKDEIRNTQLIADMCKQYDITRRPSLPKFNCPNGMNEDEYLKKLCIKGWYNKEDGWDKEKYGERVRHELGVIKEANLAGYFLIVQDYVNWAKNEGWLIGSGRGCLSKNTKIVTKNGKLTPIYKIQIGDDVYSDDGELHKVINTFKYKCTEQLVNIRTFYGHYEGITLTKDHKILVEKSELIDNYNNLSTSTQNSIKKYKDPKDTPVWIDAKDVRKNDWLYIPKPKLKTQKYIFDLAKNCDTPDTRFDDKYVYYEPHNHLCNVLMFSRKIKRFIKLDQDFARILGIFCGDGWICFNAGNKIGFAFHSKDIANINFIQNYFTNIGCKIYTNKAKNKLLVQVTILHKVIYNFFKQLFNDYTSSLTKHVPSCIFNSSQDIIASFIRGYKEADGYEGKGKITFSTISKQLAEEIKFLCLSIGIPASICMENRIGNKNITHISYIVTCPPNNVFGNKHVSNKNVYRNFDTHILVKVMYTKTINNDTNYVYDIHVSDTKNYLTSNGIVHNSVGGSLVAYLLNITSIDPIKHNLLFARFYNAGRNTADRVSLPDIDIDFPIKKRGQVIEYLKDKYGDDKVSQLSTFGRLMGRGALKEVLRVNNACDYEEMNMISKNLPQESSISDQLEATKETSIIKWTLLHDPDLVSDWCTIDDDGKLHGQYAKYFEQAIRLEGTYKSQGKHAAGVIIAAQPLNKVCPMVHDKNSDYKLAGMSLEDLEDMGHVKFDILGVALLDKLMGVNNLLQFGKVMV